jgi:hypothetical protein
MKKIWVFGVLHFFGLLSITGCMNQPLNGQTIPSFNTQVTFEGKIPVGSSSSTVVIKAFVPNAQETSFTDESRHIADFSVDATPVPDVDGKQWYHWIGKASLAYLAPGGSAWAQKLGERKLEARLWATVDGTNKLVVFDLDKKTADCYNQYKSQGNLAVIQNCKSNDNGVVTVETPCGAKDQVCCKDGTPCDQNLTCLTVEIDHSFANGMCSSPVSQ